jgi:hypothetical protein
MHMRHGKEPAGKQPATKTDGFDRVSISKGLIARVDALVKANVYSSRASAVAALITAGLTAMERTGEKNNVTADQQ